MKFFELEGRFPAYAGEVPPPAVEYLAGQVKVAAELFAKYAWTGWTIDYHRCRSAACSGSGRRPAPRRPDLLRRDFSIGATNVRWCGDVTYLPVAGRWMYLATVIDIGSQRLLGYPMAEHMHADLVIDALNAALTTQDGNVTGVIFNSYHGAQYTSKAFAGACAAAGVRQIQQMTFPVDRSTEGSRQVPAVPCRARARNPLSAISNVARACSGRQPPEPA